MNSNVSQGVTQPKQDEGNVLLREVEEVDSPSTKATAEEQLAQQHYADHVSYDLSTCRYRVRLPVKADAPSLGDSRTQALQRYLSNEKSTIRRGTWTQFQQVVKEYLDLGHAQPASD